MQNNPAILIEGATVIFSDRLAPASVRVEDGRITAIDGARDGADVIDGRGHLLAPAFVDVHGDAFERQLMPRPGTMLPVAAALLDTDRQLAANGIATAYHALTLSWEPGLRSVENGRAVVSALETLTPRLTVDNRVQLRWETFCFEAIDLIRDALSGSRLPSVAFNDHTSMVMLDPSVPLQERPFDFDPAFPMVDPETPAFVAKMAERAKRAKIPAAGHGLARPRHVGAPTAGARRDRGGGGLSPGGWRADVLARRQPDRNARFLPRTRARGSASSR